MTITKNRSYTQNDKIVDPSIHRTYWCRVGRQAIVEFRIEKKETCPKNFPKCRNCYHEAITHPCICQTAVNAQSAHYHTTL